MQQRAGCRLCIWGVCSTHSYTVPQFEAKIDVEMEIFCLIWELLFITAT